jgi:hypothetical protein
MPQHGGLRSTAAYRDPRRRSQVRNPTINRTIKPLGPERRERKGLQYLLLEGRNDALPMADK